MMGWEDSLVYLPTGEEMRENQSRERTVKNFGEQPREQNNKKWEGGLGFFGFGLTFWCVGKSYYLFI